jgi:hypothetical protein
MAARMMVFMKRLSVAFAAAVIVLAMRFSIRSTGAIK